MSHELDEMTPGIYAAAFARTDAWHRLGTTLDAEMTAEDAMDAAHLGGWGVRKISLTATELTDTGVTTLDVPDRWATVRTNPLTGATEYLGVVGAQYTTIQNEEHAELLNRLVDESGAHFDTAGSLKGGRETFMTMKLPNTMQVGGADRLDLNLVALNAHDGSAAFRFLVSPVRVVCANTQRAAIRSAAASFSIRHTASAGHELQQARETLGLTWKFIDAFQEEAEALLARPFSAGQFDAYAGQLLAVPDRAKATTRARRKLDGLLNLYRASDTLGGIRGTRWGAYQAVTEWVDHYAPVRGADKGRARAERSIASSSADNLKLAAFALASV